MATIIHDAFGGSGTPIGRTPDTIDNGNTWAAAGSDDAVWNVTTGWCVLTDRGTTDIFHNSLVIDCGTADVSITANIHGSTTGADIGPIARVAHEDSGVRLWVDFTTGTVYLTEKSTGVAENVLDSEALSLAEDTNYILVLTVNGTAITGEVYNSGLSLLGSLSGTSSVNTTTEKHGYWTGAVNNNSRCYDILIEDAVSLNATVDPNGFDITCTSTNTTIGNWTVEAGAGGSETTRTIQSIRQISATQVRIRLANGGRILSTDASVLVTSTADAITDEAATNGSVQTSTTVAVGTAGGGYIVWTFASAPTVGILASGEPTVTNAVAVTGVTYTAGTAEEQYTIHGSALNPPCVTGTEQPYHPDAAAYNVAEAISYNITLAADDCLVTAVAFPAVDTHATSTAFSLGDVILEAGRYYRCTTAGTTSGSKPTFDAATETDGTVVWTRGGTNGAGDNGRSLVRHIGILHCSGASLKSQETYRCAFSDGATKTYYTRADVNSGLLTTATTGYTVVATAEGYTKYPWLERGDINGGEESESMPEENMGHPYGRDMMIRAGAAIATVMSASSYKDTLLDYIVQRGIDYIGMREAGGYWQGFEGWTQGREPFILFVGKLLGIDWSIVKTPASGSASSADWRGLWLAEQNGYVTTAQDGEMSEGYDYFDGHAGTWVDPDSDPTTYPNNGSVQATVFFPASLVNTWLYVPEAGGRFARTPLGDDNHPTWENPTSTSYRTTIGQSVGLGAYLIDFTGLDTTDSVLQAVQDYADRYEMIQGPDGANANWNFDALWTLYESTRPAYAISSWSAVGTTVTVNFNRYTTGTAAGFAAAIAITGSITVSGGTQTGPRTWQFTASEAPASDATLTYTASSGDAVDAGNNALGDQTDVAASGGGNTASIVALIPPRRRRPTSLGW